MKLSVGETAKLFDISVRTLHYYDEIGLLPPSELSDSGYRFYADGELEKLQQILFYRELGFPLSEIKTAMSRPDYDRTKALQNRRELLLLKRAHIDAMLRLVEETIGGKKMEKPKITTADFDSAKAKYAAEAKERWGMTDAYRESGKKHAAYDAAKEAEIAEKAGEIFTAFAESMDKAPADMIVQELVARWQAHITEYHYKCTKEILASLGEMYAADERFISNIDRYGDGTAKFMSEAIREFCG
ncbi:MAG: MerR family transcriptional regulator [Oscillospiraceae bacterium]